MNHIGPKMDQKRLKIVFLYNCLFAEILFAQHTLSEEIILNEVSLGGSPTINCALDDGYGIARVGAKQSNNQYMTVKSNI